MVRILDYIADDNIPVKNLRVLFAFFTNQIGQLNDRSFELLKKGIGMLLEQSYDLEVGVEHKIHIDDKTQYFFNNQASIIQNKKHYIVEEGMKKDTLKYIGVNGPNWVKCILNLDFSDPNSPFV